MAMQDLPKSVIGSVLTITVAFQQQLMPMPTTVALVSGAAFVPPVQKPDGCIFCANYSHHIQDCPVAQDYSHGQSKSTNFYHLFL